jgi:hypothetical protein
MLEPESENTGSLKNSNGLLRWCSIILLEHKQGE